MKIDKINFFYFLKSDKKQKTSWPWGENIDFTVKTTTVLTNKYSLLNKKTQENIYNYNFYKLLNQMLKSNLESCNKKILSDSDNLIYFKLNCSLK